VRAKIIRFFLRAEIIFEEIAMLGKQTKKDANPPGPLESSLRETIKAQGKADSTADCYWEWTEKFLRWAARQHGEWKHPKDLGKLDVEAFLSMLANQQRLAANSQNQAFSALCFLYRHIIKRPLEGVSALRSKRSQTVREIADQSEIVSLFGELNNVALLAARMMYASSFRIGELGKLRIKDLQFERRQIIIRGAKGKKDRIVPFPDILHPAVQRQVESMRVLWASDVADGLAGVSLPDAYGRKSPSSHLDFAWWYLFAADNYSRCPHSKHLYRHHRDMGHIARQIKEAAINSGCNKKITSHCLRHSFCTHSLEMGTDIHLLREIMGHVDLATTETYLHATKERIASVKSPLESLLEQPSIARAARQQRDAPVKTIRLFVG
jgi:integron integrase